jgi:tRNA-binding protein
MHVGTIIGLNDFPGKRKPAYQLTMISGNIGILKTSAQITKRYTKDDLINRQIVAVVNFQKSKSESL